MQAQALISSSIEYIHPDMNGSSALSLMDKYKIHHIAVVRDNYFKGVLSSKEIMSWNSTEESIASHITNLASPHVKKNQHLFDIIEILEKNNLSIVPVLDNENRYLGVITIQKLLQTIAKSSAIQSVGGVIILKMNNRDYSLTEIASIVESYNTKILSSYITSKPNSTNIELTIKLNKKDILSIKKDFERRGYQITASYTDEEKENFDSLERYESLIRFLNP